MDLSAPIIINIGEKDLHVINNDFMGQGACAFLIERQAVWIFAASISETNHILIM
jgi:hypothetical protein